MTALPKRKPARRTTMAKPEPERPVPSWDELTAPLQHYEYPVWPQAWWTASHAYSDELAAGYTTDQVLLDEWVLEAYEKTFYPLEAWLRETPVAPLPAMMP